MHIIAAIVEVGILQVIEAASHDTVFGSGNLEHLGIVFSQLALIDIEQMSAPCVILAL